MWARAAKESYIFENGGLGDGSRERVTQGKGACCGDNMNVSLEVQCEVKSAWLGLFAY